MNLIHGRHVFRVAGFNMVLSDDGAAAYLENGIGTTFPLVVDEVVSKQLFKAHTAELLPAGDYKLVVKSRAGDAAGPLQTSFRRVKYLHVEDPEPEPIAESSDGVVKVMAYSPQTVPFGGSVTVTGSGLNFDSATGIGVSEARVDLPDDPGNIVTITGRSDGSISMTLPEGSGGAEPGTYSCTLYLLYSADGDPDHGTETISFPIQVVVG